MAAGAVLAALQCIVGCLKGAIKTDKPPQEAQILAKYDKVCIVIDEVIHEVRPSHRCCITHANRAGAFLQYDTCSALRRVDQRWATCVPCGAL